MWKKFTGEVGSGGVGEWGVERVGRVTVNTSKTFFCLIPKSGLSKNINVDNIIYFENWPK